MSKTYVLHHNDPDGFGAAYAAYTTLGKKNVEYIAVDYGQPQPEIPDGSTVFILDFSYPRAILDSLVARMKFVKVIDHHKSAMLDLEGHPNAIFDMNKSGAGLAWDYFSNQPRPDYINYIEDADLWRFALPDSKFVKNSIYQQDLTLDAYIKGAKTSISRRVKEGKVIQKVIDHNLEMGFANKHIIEVDEYKMLAVNVCLHMSEFGNALFREHLAASGADFAGVYYRYTQDTFKFSLRSVGDFDVSLICKRFGGGGHKNAAGFEIKVDEFNPVKIVSSTSKLKEFHSAAFNAITRARIITAGGIRLSGDLVEFTELRTILRTLGFSIGDNTPSQETLYYSRLVIFDGKNGFRLQSHFIADNDLIEAAGLISQFAKSL